MEVHSPTWRPSVTFSLDASGLWGCGVVGSFVSFVTLTVIVISYIQLIPHVSISI